MGKQVKKEKYPSTIAGSTGRWPRTTTRVSVEGVEYAYPQQYGLEACAAHDVGLEPYCTGAKSSWCEATWCYVDTSKCNRAVEKSTYFSTETLWFSYETCGSTRPSGGPGTQAEGAGRRVERARARVEQRGRLPH